jgi:hypothetical protein
VRRELLVVVAAVVVAVSAAMSVACGSSSSPTAADRPPTSGDGTPITGTERLGWTQAASSLDEARSYSYAVYVDGSRTLLNSPTCAAGATPSAYDCAAPLPRLAAGRHVLEVVAIDPRGAEGPRSQPLIVVMAAS